MIPWISLLINLSVSSFPKKKPRREDSQNTDNTNVLARHGYRDSRHDLHVQQRSVWNEHIDITRSTTRSTPYHREKSVLPVTQCKLHNWNIMPEGPEPAGVSCIQAMGYKTSWFWSVISYSKRGKSYHYLFERKITTIHSLLSPTAASMTSYHAWALYEI